MSRQLTPQEVCEALLGGRAALARIVGRNEKTLYGWARSSQSRAAGDLPSPEVQRRVLAHCDRAGIPLDPRWLIEGAPAEEIARLAELVRRLPQGEGAADPVAAE